MLTAYLVCLVVGGVFVGLSVFAGMKEGGGADKDVGGKDFDKDLGGKDFDKSFEKDFDKSFDKSFDKDLELDELSGGHGGAPLQELGHGAAPLQELGHGGAPLQELGHAAPSDGQVGHGSLAHVAPTSDAALAGHPGEKRQVPRRRFHYKPGPWLPFTSLRFWTFGSCFFGLTGVALTQLAGVGEPAAALASLGVGLASGTGTAWLVRKLRQPVGAVGGVGGWVGVIGELTHPLEVGHVSKVRVRQPGRPPRELLAVLARNSRPLPRDCKVVVLDFRDGQAVVEAADPSMLTALPATPGLGRRDAVAVQAQSEPEEDSA